MTASTGMPEADKERKQKMASIVCHAAVPVNRIAGVVLAGGRATRMGGQDKGLLLIDGEPMVTRICQVLRPQVGRLLINANRNVEEYISLTGCLLVRDEVDGFAGPLAGMAAALAASNLPYLVAVPCDSPFLDDDLVRRLYHDLIAEEAEIAMAMFRGRPQPVFVLLSRHLLPDLTQFLHEGGRKIIDWYYRHRVAEVDFSDRADMFENINTPQEQARIEQQLRNVR